MIGLCRWRSFAIAAFSIAWHIFLIAIEYVRWPYITMLYFATQQLWNCQIPSHYLHQFLAPCKRIFSVVCYCHSVIPNARRSFHPSCLSNLDSGGSKHPQLAYSPCRGHLDIEFQTELPQANADIGPIYTSCICPAKILEFHTTCRLCYPSPPFLSDQVRDLNLVSLLMIIF
jgi:hypothetical protein